MQIAIGEAQKSNREFLEDHLQRWGHDAESFGSGAAILDRLKKAAPPRLLLLSWELPAPSAPELCRRIRELEGVPPTHVCLLVSRARFHEALKAVSEGLADDCLLLPLDAYPLEVLLVTARKKLALRGQLARTEAELGNQTLRDGLTGLWSRDASLSFLDRELAGSRREGTPVAAVLLDLTGLRDLYDRHGLELGNQTFAVVAERLRTAIRATDWAGRYSRHQILVVLPNCGEARARSVGSRLGQVIREGLAAASSADFTGVRYGALAAEKGEKDVHRFLSQVEADLTVQDG
ncbi:MAG: diguanylate cyclase [Acidobacteria bacterium]|nr:diguanylate cyclase [Acidobacteriota bacterium]